jgi:carboxylesterase
VKNIAYSGFANLFIPYKIKKTMKDDLLPWQGYKVFPMKANFQLFLLQRTVKYQLNKISQPIVIFQGKYDRTSEPESSLEIYESISSNQKTIIMMEESGHCVLLDKEFEKVNSMSLNFIQQVTFIP